MNNSKTISYTNYHYNNFKGECYDNNSNYNKNANYKSDQSIDNNSLNNTFNKKNFAIQNAGDFIMNGRNKQFYDTAVHNNNNYDHNISYNSIINQSNKNEDFNKNILDYKNYNYIFNHNTKSEDIEKYKADKLSMYKQDLLKQIAEDKTKKENERRLKKLIDEDEEKKVLQYLNKKTEFNKLNNFNNLNTNKRDKIFQESSFSNKNCNIDNNTIDADNTKNIEKREIHIKKSMDKLNTNINDTINRDNDCKDNKKNNNFVNKYENVKEDIDSNVINVNIESFKPPPIDNFFRTRTLQNELTNQIHALRKDLSKRTLELGDYISNLKTEVKEANRLKLEAENELYNLRLQLDNRRVENALVEERFTKILDENAPYNNLHIPINEVHPLEIKRKNDLKILGPENDRKLMSNSEFYYNDDIIINNNKDNLNYNKELSQYYPKSNMLEKSKIQDWNKSLEGTSEFQSIPLQAYLLDSMNKKTLDKENRNIKPDSNCLIKNIDNKYNDFDNETNEKDFVDKIKDLKNNNLENSSANTIDNNILDIENMNKVMKLKLNNNYSNNSEVYCEYKNNERYNKADLKEIDNYLSNILDKNK